MKLLVLCERVDAEGGTETYLRTVLPALVARGDEVLVAARNVTTPDAYGVPAETVAWSDEHDPPARAAAERLAALMRAFAPDTVVAHNVLDAGVLSTARANARRLIYHLHDHRPFCPNGDRLYPQGAGICAVAMGGACAWHALVHGCAYGPRPRTLGLIALRQNLARVVAEADATIALSRYVADLAARNGVARERLRVVAPPLADDAFAFTAAARPAADTVLFAGRVMPSKGARSLVRVLARIDVASRPLLRIAGDGPDLDATLAEARTRGIRVETLGRLDAAALRRAYDDATLVAMPSLWGEPFGLVGIEAFARGRPVVAYAAGGIPEWIGAGGLAVKRGDEAALAQAMHALLAPATWNAASAHAFAASQTYRLPAHVERLRALYAT